MPSSIPPRFALDAFLILLLLFPVTVPGAAAAQNHPPGESETTAESAGEDAGGEESWYEGIPKADFRLLFEALASSLYNSFLEDTERLTPNHRFSDSLTLILHVGATRSPRFSDLIQDL